MKLKTAKRLICPACGLDKLKVLIQKQDLREIRIAKIVCPKCGKSYHINQGIADFLIKPSQGIVKEKKGLKKIAAVIKAKKWLADPEFIKLPKIKKRKNIGKIRRQITIR
ncbi:MAG TPA: hypothetical protein VJJ80_00440 [Patescibacteria group bacterium]|nr:hypothetical protein [Patescibacteria group bacterium]